MDKPTFQFVACEVGAGCVSADGSAVTLEFEVDGERLWLTLPAGGLDQLQGLVSDLRSTAIDAKNGVARSRFVGRKA